MIQIAIDEDKINEYNSKGYLIVNNVIDEKTIEILKHHANKFAIAPDFPVVLNIHRKMKIFGEVMLNEKLLNVISSLNLGEVDGLNSQYLFKRAKSKYGLQSWLPHQDNAYVEAPYGHYTIAHLSLDSSNKMNGGLIFWEGSHKEDLYKYDYNSSWMEETNEQGITTPGLIIKNFENKFIKKDITLESGSICFMHGNLVHSSYPNKHPNFNREQYSMTFLNKGSHFNPGRTSIKMRYTIEDLNDTPEDPLQYQLN